MLFRALFLLAALFHVAQVGAQLNSGTRRLSEATITYAVSIRTANAEPRAADLMDGAENVVYLKGNLSRSDLTSALGRQSTIVDAKTGAATVIKEYGEQRYLINLTPAEWKSSNQAYDSVRYQFTGITKTIAGYTCEQAIGTWGDGNTYTVFFTKALQPVNHEFQYLNRNLPGLAMEYQAKLGKSELTYTAVSIRFDPVPHQQFELPTSGYRVMTYLESKGGRKQ
jgi:GLPGLI family protein